MTIPGCMALIYRMLLILIHLKMLTLSVFVKFVPDSLTICAADDAEASNWLNQQLLDGLLLLLFAEVNSVCLSLSTGNL